MYKLKCSDCKTTHVVPFLSSPEHNKNCGQKLRLTSNQLKQAEHSKNVLSTWIKNSKKTYSLPPSQCGTPDTNNGY